MDVQKVGGLDEVGEDGRHADVLKKTADKNLPDELRIMSPGEEVPQYGTPYKPLKPHSQTALKEKLENRTITSDEYKHLEWDRRFNNRRQRGVSRFWATERRRLKGGESGTRNWTEEQMDDLLHNPRPKTPKYDGKPMEGYHRYNALNHPHLADDPDNIYPATCYEHLQRWHGGHFQNNTFGQPLNPLIPEEF